MDDGDRFSGRIDWQSDAKNTVFTRFTFTNRNRFIPGNFRHRIGFGRDNSQAEQDPFGLNKTSGLRPGCAIQPDFRRRRFSGGTPGVITSLAGDPRIMQFALRMKF